MHTYNGKGAEPHDNRVRALRLDLGDGQQGKLCNFSTVPCEHMKCVSSTTHNFGMHSSVPEVE